MDTCLWVVGCKKPNPRMNSCMESRVWNLTLSMDLWIFVWNYDYLYGYMFVGCGLKET